jgi:hypothetical protein
MFKADDTTSLLINKEAVLVKMRFDGPWRGQVVYNLDPQQQGRVKIRVWEIHGPEHEEFQPLPPDFIGPPAPWQVTQERGTSVRGLPWARPIFPVGGGGGTWDSGAFDVPPVGSNVVVFFEGGNSDSPLYLGTYHDVIDPWDSDPSLGGEVEEVVGVRRMGKVRSGWEQKNGGDLPIQSPSMGDWWTPGRGGNQAPLESQDMVDHDPTVRVLFKSIKGHTIVCDDADAREFLEILDRAGQGIRFECYVSAEANLGNMEQRGLRSVFRGDQIDRKKIVGRETRIALADILNQGLLIDSREGEERVKLVSWLPGT